MAVKKKISIFLNTKIAIYRWLKYVEYFYHLLTDKLLFSQLRNPKSIPFLIINFNQLYYFKNLVNDLTNRNFEKIVVIDNHSDYLPLLEYYKELELKSNIIIERMDYNYGHKVFFENEKLQKKYGQGFYVLTDSDINFYQNMPENFIRKLLNLLNLNHQKVTKVGFALNNADIPDHYNLKEKVIQYEKRFWENRIKKNLYFAPVDTTFALYLPGFPKKNFKNGYYRALRLAGNYTVKHGGWYHDSRNPTEEHLHYLKSSTKSYSWKTDKEGNLTGDQKDKY